MPVRGDRSLSDTLFPCPGDVAETNPMRMYGMSRAAHSRLDRHKPGLNPKSTPQGIVGWKWACVLEINVFD